VDLWASYLTSARQLRSEVFRYRSKIGEYNPTKSKVGSNELVPKEDGNEMANYGIYDLYGGQVTPATYFSRRQNEILTDLAAARQGTGAMVNPPSNYRQESNKITPENSLRMLTADDYYSERLLPTLKKYEDMAPVLERRVAYLQTFLLIATAAPVLLASFKVNVWIPATVAVSGATQSVLGYTQVSSRLTNINAAIVELTALRTWWNGLSLMEKRIPAVKQILVETCEATVNAELRSWATSVKSYRRSQAEDAGVKETDDDDGKGKGKGKEKGKGRGKNLDIETGDKHI
jgi:hypothetical protein